MQTKPLKHPEVSYMPYNDLVRDYEVFQREASKEIALAKLKLETPIFQDTA